MISHHGKNLKVDRLSCFDAASIGSPKVHLSMAGHAIEATSNFSLISSSVMYAVTIGVSHHKRTFVVHSFLSDQPIRDMAARVFIGGPT